MKYGMGNGMDKEPCIPDSVAGKLPSEIFSDMMCDETSKLGNTEATDRDNLVNNR